jgi:CRP-like cAMP-binding protein
MDFRETTHSGFSIDEGYAPVFGRSVRPVEKKKAPTQLRPAMPAVREPENLIIKALSPQSQRSLETSLRRVNLTKEQFLYQEGDDLEYIYFPLTAVVSEFKILEDGRMVEIAVTGREGAVGLSSLFSDSHTAPNCTQVSQAGTALRLDAETFEKLLKTDESLKTSVSHFVDLYIRQISQKAICNMYHSVKERLCTWLLMVQDRCEKNMLNLTHEQIARTLGVYRPSITCIAQELRSRKLINYSRGGISIVDRKRVEEAACTCYFESGCTIPTR